MYECTRTEGIFLSKIRLLVIKFADLDRKKGKEYIGGSTCSLLFNFVALKGNRTGKQLFLIIYKQVVR